MPMFRILTNIFNYDCFAYNQLMDISKHLLPEIIKDRLSIDKANKFNQILIFQNVLKDPPKVIGTFAIIL